MPPPGNVAGWSAATAGEAFLYAHCLKCWESQGSGSMDQQHVLTDKGIIV